MRKTQLTRKTNETDVNLSLDLDGTGQHTIATGIGFFDHMLAQLAKHAWIDLELQAKGDLDVDMHHTVEDVGILLGQAFVQTLGDKTGILRYGSSALPMDETLTRCALDLSGRPFLVWKVAFPTPKVGAFDTELVREFFQAFASAGRITLHMETVYGENSHHIAETCFKALALALRGAIHKAPNLLNNLPSTKGVLS